MGESLVSGPARCAWARGPWLQPYHDREWGAPLHDDRGLYEMLVLEGMQAGLNWEIMLKKRAALREAMAGFDPAIVAGYGAGQVEALLANPGIIRNRLKIEAAVHNARVFLETQAEFGSFDRFLWGLAGGETIHNAWQTPDQIPARTPLSETMSRELTRRGFKFVGPTICYALMQSVGIINDHTVDCFRYEELKRLS